MERRGHKKTKVVPRTAFVASLFDAGISLQKGRPNEVRSILLMLGFPFKKEDRMK
jgi:hypothetical protein